MSQHPAKPATSHVAEIVTFRLAKGAARETALKAAQATTPFLEATGQVRGRSLSCDEDGLWTDHIVWTSMEAARAAQGEAMQRPEFGAFFSMIDESTVSLRHAPILLGMD